MKTKSHRRTPGTRAADARPRRTVNGKRVVLLEESEYQRLLQKADEWEPPMPPADADGNYPALEAAAVSIARSIIRDRRRLGLTRADLARRAGIRPQTLDRIEQAKASRTVATIAKIDRALRKAEAGS